MSTRKPVLIFTEKFDPHADAVIKALNERDWPFFRLNTTDFHTDYQVTLGGDDASMRFEDRWGRSVNFPAEVHSAWHRKPDEPRLPESLDEPTKQTIRNETLELMNYLSCIRSVPWYNNQEANRVAQRKFPQLCLARELGLSVPRTLITNDPEKVKAFSAAIGGPLLCKSMKEPGYSTDSDSYFIFSRRVGEQELTENADKIALCATFFQEYIPKAYELRVTVMGEAVFCCRIDSQSAAGAETDWRMVTPDKIVHSLIDLDPPVAARLKEMLRRYGLRFGAFDLIVTPQGEVVFLELNPNGQWLWIELMTGAPMTEAMTDLLLS